MRKLWSEENILIKLLQAMDIPCNPGQTMPCPLPDHNDSNPSCRISKKGTYYNCFACGEKGNAIDYLKLFGYSVRQSVEILKKVADNEVKITTVVSRSYKTKQRKYDLYPYIELYWLKYISPDFFYEFISNTLISEYTDQEVWFEDFQDLMPHSFRNRLEDMIQEFYFSKDPENEFPIYKKLIEIEIESFVKENFMFDVSEYYDKIEAVTEDVRAVDDPFSQGPQEVAKRGSAAANACIALDTFRLAITRERARLTREQGIKERIFEREVYRDQRENAKAYSKLRTKDERRAAAEDKYWEDKEKAEALADQLDEVKGLLDCLDSLFSSTKQVLYVCKTQMEALTSDSTENNFPVHDISNFAS